MKPTTVNESDKSKEDIDLDALVQAEIERRWEASKEEMIKDNILDDMLALYAQLKKKEPYVHGDDARWFAVCVTEFEKAISCYYAMITADLFSEYQPAPLVEKPEKLEHITEPPTVEDFNALIDCINALTKMVVHA